MLPKTPPVPIASHFYPGTPNELEVVFDQQLKLATGLDVGNWTARFLDVAYTASGVVTAENHAVLQLVTGGADIGNDIVSYAPPPSDVVNRFGENPALAFTDYPIT